MTNDDNINVEYDTSGVPIPDSSNISGFSRELSLYLYPKLSGVVNEDSEGEVEFSNEDILEYGLDVSNNLINISTTKKLINYLKAFTKKYIADVEDKLSNINNLLATKLNKSEYIIDNNLSDESENPVANNVLYDKFQDVSDELDLKSNNGHTHDISDINNLSNSISNFESSLDSKVSYNEFVIQLSEIRQMILKLSSDYNQVQQFTSGGVTVTVYTDGLNVFVSLFGTKNKNKNGESDLTQKIESIYCPHNRIVVGTHSGATTHKALLKTDGTITLLFSSTSDTTDVNGSVMYPLKSRFS